MKTDVLPVQSGRKVYIDALRILAAFFVIFNHTRTNGFFLFAEREWGSAAFWCYLFFSVFCKVSVPLFLAISGALMLHRENEPLGVLWRKRIGKILAILVLFVVGNAILDWWVQGKTISLPEAFKAVYTGSSAGLTYWYGHLWYLYAYIAYLCCLPFLRALVQNLENQYFYYLIAIAVVVKGILPAAEYLLAEGTVSLSSDAIPRGLLTDILLYPCIGYFLAHRVTVRKRDLLTLWLVNLACFAVTELLIYRKAVLTQVLNAEVSQGFHSMFVIVNCITVFLTFKYCFTTMKLPEILKKAIHSVGQCTFGIYLVHVMIQESRAMTDLLLALSMRINSLVSCFLQCGCVMVIGYAVTLILKKVPYLGKLLN